MDAVTIEEFNKPMSKEAEALKQAMFTVMLAENDGANPSWAPNAADVRDELLSLGYVLIFAPEQAEKAE